jgi:hypothetical protein
MWRAENLGVVCERICHVCTVINPPIDICNKSVYFCPCSCSHYSYEYKKLQYRTFANIFLISSSMGFLAGAGVSLQREKWFCDFCDTLGDFATNRTILAKIFAKNSNNKDDFSVSSRLVAFTITINNSWHTIRRAATTTIHSSHNTNRAAFIPVIRIPWTTVFREEHLFFCDDI